ncbi:hypothetical protein H4219_002631 [Mycoemilia scoparia]|uniref:MoaB/Mog domain-containing protein n=1 Tax=Mycoemilia scoparia TaxID=417184 RepID=A0A9W7ZXU3_9FUNG|nr:hypothetical protein H4219_002631 [Mycoemilia scoparia]
MLSDSCYSGESDDRSGPELCKLFETDPSESWKVGSCTIVPDDATKIAEAVKSRCKLNKAQIEQQDLCDVVVTTGGTGLTSRDITIQALAPLYTKPLPSFSTAMVVGSLKITPLAALSQVSCGIIGSTIVLSVPGSRKGSSENIQQILPILPHAVATAQTESGSSRALHAKGSAMPGSSNHSIQDKPQRARKLCACHNHDSDKLDGKVPKTQGSLPVNPETTVAGRQRKSPYPLLPFSDALKIVLDNTSAMPVQERAVCLDLVGNVLAKDAIAVENVPGYRASIVDGYAVIASDGPGVYEVVSSTTAGDVDNYGTDTQALLQSGQIARITTGAPLYPGADSVVMVEDTEVVEASEDGVREIKIKVNIQAADGDSIRDIGSDMRIGQIILRKGDTISDVGGEIGTLVAAGIPRISVFRKPRVGIASTGDEVIDSINNSTKEKDISLPPLKPGQIRDTNRPSLIASARALGLDVVDLGIIKDDPETLEAKLSKATSQCDVVITTGGVSMGEKDWIKPVIENRLGGTIHFGRIRMKPAKPTTFATIPGQDDASPNKLLFALPGNPASAMVAFHLVVLPAIKKMSGLDLDPETMGLTKLKAIWGSDDVKLDKVRPEFHRCNIAWKDGKFIARSTGGQRSSRVASMSYANALAYFPQATEELKTIASRSEVDVYLVGKLQ